MILAHECYQAGRAAWADDLRCYTHIFIYTYYTNQIHLKHNKLSYTNDTKQRGLLEQVISAVINM